MLRKFLKTNEGALIAVFIGVIFIGYFFISDFTSGIIEHSSPHEVVYTDSYQPGYRTTYSPSLKIRFDCWRRGGKLAVKCPSCTGEVCPAVEPICSGVCNLN